MTQSGRAAAEGETAVWPSRPDAAREPHDGASRPDPWDEPVPTPPWELDLRGDPPQGRYRSRRELRDERGAPVPQASDEPPGPTTQELAVYRATTDVPPPPVPGAGPARLVPWEQPPPPPPGAGERLRGSVETWSRWASGLGLPPRDGTGPARYARGERLLPPAVFIAAGLGIAGLVGLLTGVLVSGSGLSGATAAGPTTAPSTVTVTQQVTQAPVTETTTKVRTRTVTQTAPAVPTDQGGVGGGLGPGSTGARVLRLQLDLLSLGILQERPSGTYDQQTQAAVQAFQAQNGVQGDPPGVAGPATLQAIAQALGR